MRALDLVVDPSRADTDMLSIVVCPRPETDYYATAAEVGPLDDFEPAQAEEIFAQHKYAAGAASAPHSR